LRAFGTFSYQIDEPNTFYGKISGTRQIYTVAELDGQLRSAIITTIASKLGKGETPFLDLAANQTLFSDQLKVELDSVFQNYGLKLCTFLVQSITLPEELQQYLDKRSEMNLVGDLNKYAHFQAADSIAAAAQNSGGMASAGVGLGAGAMMGQLFAQTTQGSIDASHAKPQEQGDPIELLEKLGALLAKGIITQEDFDAKKAELLKRIS